MFTRTFAVLAVAGLALASGPNRLARDGSSQCNTGGIQCCNQTQTSQQAQASGLLGLLGLNLGDIGAGIAAGCSPISAVGLGSGCQANQEPVCCTGNTFNGLINIGCSPVNVGL
ncbi:hydrophobin [Hygrophoropsis aurantiaca]|uniref:Hydrophobin n=1 Tax=Hygrophoropsis aurantiaca TaxID=72124 RepID=A0ACB8AHB0_9AGAM|nr:hydrophobin [Hygrophoropsis aurantiaca]